MIPIKFYQSQHLQNGDASQCERFESVSVRCLIVKDVQHITLVLLQDFFKTLKNLSSFYVNTWCYPLLHTASSVKDRVHFVRIRKSGDVQEVLKHESKTRDIIVTLVLVIAREHFFRMHEGWFFLSMAD